MNDTTHHTYTDERVTLHHGDCLNVLRALPDCSVDAVVTDPPYGLADHQPDAVVAALTAWATGDRERVPSAKGGFMGRDWDSFVPPPAVWDECLRVLKPGGHLVAFAGSRTYDLMGLSIRMAGFEIRDGLQWIMGSGMPKGMNVAKAISAHQQFGGSSRTQNRRAAMGDAYERSASFGSGAQTATTTATTPMKAAPPLDNLTPEAAQWEGWNTALKPAVEPAVLARKPLGEKTVARNVLEHGTGALNIDATRTGTVSDGPGTTPRSSVDGRRGSMAGALERVEYDGSKGRWPANVLLSHSPLCEPPSCEDGCPVAELDRQSGNRPGFSSQTDRAANKTTGTGTFHAGLGIEAGHREGYNDSGGASRFFATFRYQAKAPASERPKIDGKGWPTVKHQGLMRWIVRLITPPGGTVLDPFAGTSSTLQAARDEGFHAIGVERDPFAYQLSLQRLGQPATPEPVSPPPPAATAEVAQLPGQADLFDLLEGEAS